MSKRSHSLEFKLEVLAAYKNIDSSVKDFCTKYKINKKTLYRWINIFDLYGKSGLEPSTSWKKYSKELKESAVKSFLTGNYSLNEIVLKYGISSESVLESWINKYNSHRDLKDTSKGRTSSMTKRRKTTLDERIQIVLDCLRNGKDFQRTAETYRVSYQQVYQWVRKYEDGGDDALKDGRGRKKEEAELTSEELTQLKMKKLESENERLRAENLFLKKLEEIERRRK
jgi:transposase